MVKQGTKLTWGDGERGTGHEAVLLRGWWLRREAVGSRFVRLEDSAPLGSLPGGHGGGRLFWLECVLY